MDAADWDNRYNQAELVWGAPPNAIVAEQVTTLAPGRALDLGCGEGRNTLWLATRGWQVDALDWSRVGIDKARTVAVRLPRAVRERIDWHCCDLTQLDAVDVRSPFDLVAMIFIHLPADERRTLLRHTAQQLAPGGTLLVIGHDTRNHTEGHGGPPDPDILFTPADIVADLDGILQIRTAERRLRPTEGRDAIDALVVAGVPLPEATPDPTDSPV